MGRAKRHHQVPAFYLRRFADPKGRVRVFDRVTRRTFGLPVSDAAVESNLYTVQDDRSGPSDAVERFLARFEGEAAGPLRALLAPRPAISTPERAVVAHFVALQFIRTAAARARLEDIADIRLRFDVEANVGEHRPRRWIASSPSGTPVPLRRLSGRSERWPPTRGAPSGFPTMSGWRRACRACPTSPGCCSRAAGRCCARPTALSSPPTTRSRSSGAVVPSVSPSAHRRGDHPPALAPPGAGAGGRGRGRPGRGRRQPGPGPGGEPGRRRPVGWEPAAAHRPAGSST